MKKILILSICVCLLFLTLSVMPVHGEAEIYDGVLRLHVLASSDSEEDQALKLLVRDRVIEITKELTRDCEDLADTRAVLTENLSFIAEESVKVIEQNGYAYGTEVRICKEEYPRKTYASLCFPAGEYLSLQVRIGEAAGENWWCVLFPPLCLDAASESNEDAFISVGFTPEQYKVITETDSPKYKARFKLLEVIEEMNRK